MTKEDVRKINNEYVRHKDRQSELKKKHRVRVWRRIGIYSIVPIILLVVIVITLIKQQEMLDNKQALQAEVGKELDTHKEKQKELKVQIQQLQDDDYIAKLLRKEYLLSEDGEIIFIMPKEEEENSK
ncbi:cell division protein DIVIC [Lysinibacillus alkalisoli]|uniref:Cell division protein DIVIC n=1 Tax=Lysinibacillus alkalisoli TaxID=1911548 RepID=A0A917GAL3_9BACI|nr:septum formation initiator family protein [Lysinibacillus alkalisoli]GGG33158.1 cell division protein DIVIC [Lysinibacillus alkalisoli]